MKDEGGAEEDCYRTWLVISRTRPANARQQAGCEKGRTVDEAPIVGRDDAGQVFKQVMALQGPPAYIRRANEVQQAFEHLLAHCKARRQEWLKMVRIRLKA